jgi:hypothetical protein
MNDLEVVLDELVSDAPVERASWDDVRMRARRSRRRTAVLRRRTAVLAIAAVLAVIVMATPAFGLGDRLLGLFDGTPVTSDRLSREELHIMSAMAHGVSPRVPASQREDLRRIEASSLREIATRNDRAFFVADRRGGGLCVSIGTVGATRLFGSIVCVPDFPSPLRPILDRSVFRGSVTQPIVSRLEGFAADGVASVGVVNANGDLEALTPVQDNVYSRIDGLPRQTIRRIVAFDANGKRLYSQCYAGVCGQD